MQPEAFQISDITFSYLCIPFNERFAHAAATRTHTESVWVTITTSDGVTGYGEGCPRWYVSGESLQSAAEFIQVIRDEIKMAIHGLGELRQWVSENADIIDTNPAAWSAIELALLDIIAKRHGESIETILNVAQQQNVFRYTAVLGNNPLKQFAKQALQYAQLGFRDFKVKLSGILSEDRNKLDLLQCMLADPIRIRLDANNLWTGQEEVNAYLRALRTPVFAIEEPVIMGMYADLRAIAYEQRMPVILDESFQRIQQLENIRGDSANWIINLRVSKMGGLLRSLAVIHAARQANIPIIVGAHVGETSLMTRAGMVVARAAGDALLAQEGGFGTLLLQHDVCDTPLMFGKMGELELDAWNLHPVSFGLSIVQENLRG